MLQLPIFEFFINVGNVKPKPKCFFRPKLKLKLFLLNYHPDPRGQDQVHHVGPGGVGAVEGIDGEGGHCGAVRHRDARLHPRHLPGSQGGGAQRE